MTYDIADLNQKTIFVDAGAIIYHLQGLSKTSKDIFESAEKKEINLITTTRVIDEVIHKILLIKAREQYGFTSKTIEKLRKDKTKIKVLSESIRIIYQFIRAVHLQVKSICYNDLKKLPDMSSLRTFSSVGLCYVCSRWLYGLIKYTKTT